MKKDTLVTRKSFEIKRKRSLIYSKIEGAFASVMSGFGENYITPFAILLKATTSQIALITSIIHLTSSLSQLVSVRLLRFLESRKKVVLYAVFFHALMWIIIFLASYITKSPSLLLILYGLYFFIGSLASPSWVSWMGDLVPVNERGKYFGSRNRITGFFGFASVIIAGLILNAVSKINIFLGFGIIFLIAAIARFISFLLLKKQYDPPHIVLKEDRIGMINFFKNIRKNNLGLFSSYVSTLHLMANIAGPFFAVYLLRNLQVTYLQYAIITGSSAVSTFLTMSYWGKFSDKFGNKKIIEVTGILVAIIPFLWLLDNRIYYLMAVNLFAGFSWAGFNLSSSNFLFDLTKPEKRAESISYFNLLQGLSIVIGATIGALIVPHLPLLPFMKYSILTIFFISGIGRLLTSIYFLPKIYEVRVTEYKPRNLFRLLTIEPIEGLIYEGISGLNKTMIKLRKGLNEIEYKRKNRLK